MLHQRRCPARPPVLAVDCSKMGALAMESETKGSDSDMAGTEPRVSWAPPDLRLEHAHTLSFLPAIA